MAAECFLPVRPGSRGGVAGGGPGWQPGILHLSSTCLAHSHLPLGPPRFSPRCMSVSLSGSNGQPTDISPPTKRFLNTTSHSRFSYLWVLVSLVKVYVIERIVFQYVKHCRIKQLGQKLLLTAHLQIVVNCQILKWPTIQVLPQEESLKDFDPLLTIRLTMVDNCSPAKLKFCRFLARLERLVRR